MGTFPWLHNPSIVASVRLCLTNLQFYAQYKHHVLLNSRAQADACANYELINPK
jgi:hypothetical protein